MKPITDSVSLSFASRLSRSGVVVASPSGVVYGASSRGQALNLAKQWALSQAVIHGQNIEGLDFSFTSLSWV